MRQDTSKNLTDLMDMEVEEITSKELSNQMIKMFEELKEGPH